jgi:hypothetical protein
MVHVLVAVLLLLAPAPAWAQGHGACLAPGPDWPLPGSVWTSEVFQTGSLGSGRTVVTSRLLGQRILRGEQVVAVEEDRETWYFDAELRLAGHDGPTGATLYQPPVPIFRWPLTVGAAWSSPMRIIEGGRVSASRAWFRVEAFEEIVTPAGRFVAFRVRQDGVGERVMRWWSPLLGIVIRTEVERDELHRSGLGTSRSELLSVSLTPDLDL